ncbi:hypothetical protein B0H16DRAFT_1323267 [Mycena metata]|uniref:DUF6589 domain-containing protein n=1 Tax=Mycena metata TaxID=1033252 RepID=A0AAD7N2E7_9AGAR|nr:hypothetical protein B0H16DRAFT_1323267 [Mycena metata]
MSRLDPSNRYRILSSEADDALPPSDEPEPLSGSESDSATPRRPLPPLFPNLLANYLSPTQSSPLAVRIRRVFRNRSPVRESSEPPHESSEDTVLYTPTTERKVLTVRAQEKRRETLESSAAAQADQARLDAEELAMQRARKDIFDNFLAELQVNDISVAEFADYVFNPENKFDADWRWRGFFARRPLVEQIFGYWTTSKYNITTRAFLDEWAQDHIARKVYSEGQAITKSGLLSKAKKVVNEAFFLDFNLETLTDSMRRMAPFAFAILDVFSTTARQLSQMTPRFLQKKEMMTGAAALTLLRSRSQRNNYAQSVTGTYLAATGGQRQHFSVLGVYGFSMGYNSIVSRSTGKPSAEEESYKRRKCLRSPGLFSFLRDACMATTREVAATRKLLTVYDNVNLMNRIAEQILGRKNAQENGTCATVIPLHNTELEHLLTSELDKSILAARKLTIDDITLSAEESQVFVENMVHTMLRTIVLHGGEGFEKWKTELDAAQPVSADAIAVHKTPLHPLPSMEIDESSITGNVEVIEEIVRVLGFKTDDPDYVKYIQIISGDQLTIARQRSILNVRLGHESGPHAWRHIVLMPGLFHAKIADCHGVLETHFGKANVRSPGSLAFHNTVLDRLPIVLTSLPSFRTCRDLIMVSFYARVLHCLLLVSGKDSLEACAASIDSFSTLVGYAKAVYVTYADVDRVQELRERRVPEERKREATTKAAKKSSEPSASEKPASVPHVQKGDMVFENAVLFLRDALLTREFSDAVKAGDSGRVLIVLRLWAFLYRGSGRSKYAHEMLHLLHNMICVWTRELRAIIMQNWLANPQGKANAFVEIDLVQEHLNFWIKKIYKADGAGHSWDWLALISPCVDILRQLATKINVDLGARQGSKHATPDLADDIDVLMDSLAEHEVYIEKDGRVLDDDEKPVPDVISVGMAALTHGATTTPLDDFNTQFETLRSRRQLTPVYDLLGLINVSGRSPPPTSDSDIPAATASGATESNEDDYADLPDLEQPDSDSDDELDGEGDDEDLFAESPTLTRLDEGDLELDMDDVPEWYLDENQGESSDSDSDDDVA